jgi:2,3-bisphosphoglycerate-dependent phosphoglycerate mutase
MVRAVKTGSIVAKRLHIPLQAWEELHERGGIYLEDQETRQILRQAGKTRDYFASHYPELVLPDKFPEAGWWNFRPHEPPEASIERARRFLAGLLDKHGDSSDRVAVVSHGGFYNDFLDTLLHHSGLNGAWFSMYNTAVTRIDFHDDIVELVYQNRIDFMPKEWVT